MEVTAESKPETSFVPAAEEASEEIILPALCQFVDWLEHFGEVSQDHYDFWANAWGQRAKALYYRNPWLGAAAVAPFIFLDSFLPSTRRWFWSPRRFPIADAHFAMGFAYLYRATGEDKYYEKAVHFLETLEKTRCPGFEHYGWGYPFNWMTNSGPTRVNTPLITTTPYVYEAFAAVYEIDREARWLRVLCSIAEHVANDYYEMEISEKVRVCSYIAVPRNQPAPGRFRPIVNSNAYRAFMLTEAARRFVNESFWEIAQGNLNFVLESQQPDGSWFYAAGKTDPFVDHFHTCFVLKNLIKIERLTGHKKCQEAIKRGLAFYLTQLLDGHGLPKPFAKTPRVTLYRRELYDYAESLNLTLLCLENRAEFEAVHRTLLADLLRRWQKPDGSFRTRQLLLGWNNVPYHRWAQSQLFRSLALCLLQEKEKR
ncbi:MAG: hypothetical protein ACE5HO_11690 [bacterium]